MVYYLVVDRDGAGQNFHPLEYLDRVAAIANAPIYCWVDSAMEHGIVGGSLKDQEAQTTPSAALALRVLRGERADSIPLSTLRSERQPGRLAPAAALGHQRIARARRHARQVPGASVWDRYKGYILGAMALLLAQTALIAGTARAADETATAEEQLRGNRRSCAPATSASAISARGCSRPGNRARAHRARAARRHQPADGAAGDRSGAAGPSCARRQPTGSPAKR